jgi:diguanylate cyclase (GGDEF)-like protein
MKVKDYLVNNIIHMIDIKDNFSMLEIASMFLEKKIDSLIITEDEKSIYIITQTDLIFLFFKGYEDKTLKEIIEEFPKKILTIQTNEDIYKAYKIMRNAAIEHLIVVDENEKVVGELHSKNLIMKFVEFALKDEMTGLNNKRFLETIIKKYNKTNTKIGVIFIDIDDFKHFNDTFGHDMGDEVIKIVADKIKESIREIDFGFRYGGDEFVVMVFNQEKDIVPKVANRIFEKISSINDDVFGKIGVSIGVAFYPEDSDDLEKVIKLADENLYITKNSGKGRIVESKS